MTRYTRKEREGDRDDQMVERVMDTVSKSVFMSFIGILVTIMLAFAGFTFAELNNKVSAEDFNKWETRQYKHNKEVINKLHELGLKIERRQNAN